MRLLISLSLCAALAACGEDHHTDAFANLGECVDDHTAEGLSEANSITHCLVDYPFGDGLTTEAECVAYVTDNGGYPDSRDAACVDFIEETGQ